MRPEGVSFKYKSPASAGFFCIDADALYASKSGGFGGEIGVNIS